MTSRLKDAVYGLAVGDALGVPVEFMDRNTFHVTDMTGYGTYNQPKGTWSDDTSMTIATCDSIRELGKIDCKDIYDKFCRWAFSGEYTPDKVTFDIGNATAKALRTGKGQDDYYSNGNGSLMRIIPLAFIDCGEDAVCEVSSITHAHKLSNDICVKYIAIAKELLSSKTVKEIVSDYDLSEIVERSVDDVKSTGFVVHSFEAAIWCLANTDNYKDAVLTAVNLGSDTDTVAAITGALAGIVYGFDGIPKEWIDALRAKDIIDACLF